MRIEAELAGALVGLADTLAGDFAVEDYLRSVADRCSGLVSAEAFGALLTDARGSVGVAVASTGRATALERLQLEQEEGPGVDACRACHPVSADRLEEHESRWPVFAPAAWDDGVRSAHSFPMRHLDKVVGALDVFVHVPGPLPVGEASIAQAVADLAAVGVLNDRAIRQRDETVTQLQHALDTRVVIEQAKGILVASAGVGPSDAFDALRRLARSRRLHVHEVARALIDQTLAADAVDVRAKAAGGSAG